MEPEPRSPSATVEPTDEPPELTLIEPPRGDMRAGPPARHRDRAAGGAAPPAQRPVAGGARPHGRDARPLHGPRAARALVRRADAALGRALACRDGLAAVHPADHDPALRAGWPVPPPRGARGDGADHRVADARRGARARVRRRHRARVHDLRARADRDRDLHDLRGAAARVVRGRLRRAAAPRRRSAARRARRPGRRPRRAAREARQRAQRHRLPVPRHGDRGRRARPARRLRRSRAACSAGRSTS